MDQYSIITFSYLRTFTRNPEISIIKSPKIDVLGLQEYPVKTSLVSTPVC